MPSGPINLIFARDIPKNFPKVLGSLKEADEPSDPTATFGAAAACGVHPRSFIPVAHAGYRGPPARLVPIAHAGGARRHAVRRPKIPMKNLMIFFWLWLQILVFGPRVARNPLALRIVVGWRKQTSIENLPISLRFRSQIFDFGPLGAWTSFGSCSSDVEIKPRWTT